MKNVFYSYYLDTPLQVGRVFDVFEPEKITRNTVVFFVHGGGWTSGSRSTFYPVISELNKLGYFCASTDYRLVSSGVNNTVTAFDQLADIRESYMEFMIRASKGSVWSNNKDIATKMTELENGIAERLNAVESRLTEIEAI